MNNCSYFLFLFVLFFTLPNRLLGQPVIIWDKLYGSCKDDNAMQMVATDEGGILFTAWPFRAGDGDILEKKGGRDVWACKLDAQGELVYSRVLGGSKDDYAASVIKTDDGGAIFQYGTESSDWDIPYTIGLNDEIFHKLDANGKTEWVKVFGGTGGDSGLALQKEDGNFLMYLYYGVKDGDLVAVQQDAPGQTVIEFGQDCSPLWMVPIDLQRGDETFSTRVVSTSDQGFILGMHSITNSNNQGETDACIWKYSSNRILEWESCIGGEKDDLIYHVVEIPGRGFLAGGITRSKTGDITNPIGSRDNWLLRLDKNGNRVWKKIFGGTKADGLRKIILSDNGESAILLCYTSSDDVDINSSNGGSDIWIVKTDLASGEIVWEQTYGSKGSEFAIDMVQLDDGSLVVMGEMSGFGADGDVTEENHCGASRDIWIFKLAPENIVKSEICNSFTLSPNPVSGNSIELSFDELTQSAANARVYDMKGALVAEYPDLLPPNTWKTEIELPAHLPAGVYLVQVDGCSDTPLTRKFLKTR